MEADCDADNPPALAHIQIGGIDLKIGPIALNGTFKEGIHPFLDLTALEHLGRRAQSARTGVHAADMGQYEIFGIK